MAFWELMLLAVGLSMDAFAVAICKGLAMDKVTLQRAAMGSITRKAREALVSSSSGHRASRIMLMPSRTSRAKAIQWSTAVM